MDKLKRYDQGKYGNIIPFHNGRLVRYKDVAAKISALEKENAELRKVVSAVMTWRRDWPDDEDLIEAGSNDCNCDICTLIRACDALPSEFDIT